MHFIYTFKNYLRCSEKLLITFFLLKAIIKQQTFFNYIFQEISYDSPRGGVSVITEKGDITTSYLLIQKARVSDSGKYSCSPSNANPVFVNVHILNGKFYI